MAVSFFLIFRVIFFGLLALILGLLLFTFLMTARITAQHPPQGSFVQLEGGRIHLVDLMPTGNLVNGAPRGTILLLHGASGNQADMMQPLGAPLAAAGFRVIAPDRPGHGWSDRFEGPDQASPARQAVIIRAALDKIGVKQAIVVGHSLAGAMASNFAIDHKDFTQGLGLISAVTHPWPGGIAAYYHLASTPYIGWFFTHTIALPAGLLTMPSAIKEVFAPQIPPSDFIEATGVKMVLRPEEFRANAQDVDALYDYIVVQSKRMHEITAPTGIIAGDKDSVVFTTIHSVNTEREVKGATLKILPEMGHSPHHSATAEVVEMILGVAQRAGL